MARSRKLVEIKKMLSWIFSLFGYSSIRSEVMRVLNERIEREEALYRVEEQKLVELFKADLEALHAKLKSTKEQAFKSHVDSIVGKFIA